MNRIADEEYLQQPLSVDTTQPKKEISDRSVKIMQMTTKTRV